ncbi:MAG: TldD/PmbA family protein [Clostridia bacterium]|nr:TldD/PmbA family protein [Clostridia bacterium]
MKKETFEKIYAAVEEEAVKAGASDWELYYSGDGSLSAETFRDELSGFSAGQDGWMILRLKIGRKTGCANSTSATLSEAKKLVALAAENAALCEKEEEVFFAEGGQTYKELPPCTFRMPSAKAVKDAAMEMRRAAYASSDLISDGTSGGAYASLGETFYYSSRGLRLSDRSGSCGAYVYSVLEKDGDKRDAFKVVDGAFKKIDADAAAKEASEKAYARFGATVPPGGNYPIVFEGKQMQQILGTFLPVFFAKEAQQGTSLLAGKEGEKIGAENLTVVDDPFYEGNPMQASFDGEGSPTFTKTVIDRGVLKTLLYNLETAAKAGKTTTGNASRGGSSIGTKVYNFYIVPGAFSREELFKKAEGGIFVTGMKGFHAGANTVSGDFSIESEGFFIKDGKQGEAIKSFTVSGNFFDLLKNIAAIGDTIEDQNPGVSKVRCPDVFLESMPVAGA